MEGHQPIGSATVNASSSVLKSQTTRPYILSPPYLSNLYAAFPVFSIFVMSSNNRFNLCLPVLSDVKAPFEFQMLVLVIVDKGGYGGVVTSGKHARWCIFLSNYPQLLVIVL